MYRINYSQLGLEEVKAAVLAGGGPVSAGELSDWLVTREINIQLDNEGIDPPALKYSFQSTDKLTLTENDGEPVECAYGALKLNDYVLFAHMIPETLRGYTVVLDTCTGKAAVEEMWFIDYEGTIPEKRPLTTDEIAELGFFINREVERQLYFGCFTEADRPAAEERFYRSLRLDNKMVKWDDDLGRKRIFTYVTNFFSTMVEIDTPDGEDVLTFPSDYRQLDDSTFFYSVGEVEYSGRLSVEVIDLFTMKKIGVTIGIDEDDRFEFRLYRADGKYLGQYATFYDFSDYGEVMPVSLAARLKGRGKGYRFTYRTSLLGAAPTEEEINASASKVALFDRGESSNMVSNTRMAFSKQVKGKKVMFRDDAGFFTELDFFETEKLRFRTAESDWTEAEYRAFELDADLVYLGFHIKDSVPPRGMLFALDFVNGCATCIDAKMGGGADPHDVVPEYHFGYMETEGVPVPRTRRHGFTRELLGRSFTWTYSKEMSSQHIYNSPSSYSWTIFTGGTPGDPGYRTGGFVWSSPCTYIKLRDDVYIMTWVEEKWSGSFSSAAMNLRIMHDCGFVLGCAHEGSGLLFNMLSAFARDAGKCDLSGIYKL
ncbi:MAG: MoaF N-terminal domain-containing protein [Lachnospiraceae bacterium]|nr:MoaF N-terminal domain-containing protein [Lachnospiraceae bacterium]